MDTKEINSQIEKLKRLIDDLKENGVRLTIDGDGNITGLRPIEKPFEFNLDGRCYLKSNVFSVSNEIKYGDFIKHVLEIETRGIRPDLLEIRGRIVRDGYGKYLFYRREVFEKTFNLVKEFSEPIKEEREMSSYERDRIMVREI